MEGNAASPQSAAGDYFEQAMSMVKQAHEQAVRPLLAEIAALRDEKEALQRAAAARRQAKAKGSKAPGVPGPGVLRSEAVKLRVSAADGAEGAPIWVHSAVLERVPYFQGRLEFEARRADGATGGERARGAQAPEAEPPRVCLPPRCDAEGLDMLLRRLYAGRPWPVLAWLREGPRAALGAWALADMWGLEAERKEAVAALRTALVDPATGDAMREEVRGIAVPGALADALAAPGAVAMEEPEVQKMVENQLSDPGDFCAPKWELVQSVLECRLGHGKDDTKALLDALQCHELVLYVSGPDFIDHRYSKSGKTCHWTKYGWTRKLASPPSFERLMGEIRVRARAQPTRVEQAVEALESAWKNNFLRDYGHGCRDEGSLEEESDAMLKRAHQDLMRVGQEHVRAGHLSSEEYGKLVLGRHPERAQSESKFPLAELVSVDTIRALDEPHQLQLVQRMLRTRPEWFSAARLGALHGLPRQEAAHSLVQDVRKLSPEVAKLVGFALCARASYADARTAQHEGADQGMDAARSWGSSRARLAKKRPLSLGSGGK